MWKQLKTLSEDSRDYWVTSHLQYLDDPTPLEFLQAQSSYHPFIIKNHMKDWKALNKWNCSYITKTIGPETFIPINITPDGLADCIKSIPVAITASNPPSVQADSSTAPPIDQKEISVFTYPLEVEMPCQQFMNMLNMRERVSNVIPYLSQQNDNLRAMDCYKPLLDDFPHEIQLMKEANPQQQLEALNLWIGDERSVSSIHKDHFENIYCVLYGEKTFTLLPPTDIVYLPEANVKTMKYVLKDDKIPTADRYIQQSDIDLVPDENIPRITWIPIDPNDPTSVENYPMFRFASPIHITVKAGEILYIPSMWYHRVSQTTTTIAINYWYEQRFDFRYVFFNLAKSIKFDDVIEEDEDRIPLIVEEADDDVNMADDREKEGGIGA